MVEDESRPVDIAAGLDAVRAGILNRLRAKLASYRTGSGTHVNEIRPTFSGEVAYQAEYEVAFYAGLWSLVSDGIITPGTPAAAYGGGYINGERLTFPLFTLTPFGRRWLAQPDLDPHDKSGFLASARDRLRNADERVYTYLSEANDDFLHRNYLSAAVMLGVSAEMLMKWLIERFIDHVGPKKRAEFERTRDELWKRTDKLFDTFIKAFSDHYGEMSRDLKFQAQGNLDLLQTLFRINRDDAGHGRPGRVDEHMIHGYLISYLTLLKVARELADAFAATPCALYAGTP